MRRGSLPGLVLAGVLVCSTNAWAEHSGFGLPDCVHSVPAAASASYDLGRVRVVGYASGSVGVLDLSLIDEITPEPVPNIFEPPGPPPVAQEFEVAGALVSLNMPGLENSFLLGGPPVTEIGESIFPVDLDTKTHAGAQVLSMVFNGRVRVFVPETFSCESVSMANTIFRITAQRIELDGYATALTDADDTDLEPWGLGANIFVAPGDTSGR